MQPLSNNVRRIWHEDVQRRPAGWQRQAGKLSGASSSSGCSDRSEAGICGSICISGGSRQLAEASKAVGCRQQVIFGKSAHLLLGEAKVGAAASLRTKPKLTSAASVLLNAAAAAPLPAPAP